MIVKPVCVKCQRFFRPVYNGFKFIEGMPDHGALPGTAEPEKWHPYKLWNGDKWACFGCGTEIVVGVMGGPIREHYQEDFKATVEAWGATLQVNDC
jgi:hypothetical protein